MILPEIAAAYGRSEDTIAFWRVTRPWPEPTGKRGRWDEYDAGQVDAAVRAILAVPGGDDGDPDELLDMQAIAAFAGLRDTAVPPAARTWKLCIWWKFFILIGGFISAGREVSTLMAAKVLVAGLLPGARPPGHHAYLALTELRRTNRTLSGTSQRVMSGGNVMRQPPESNSRATPCGSPLEGDSRAPSRGSKRKSNS
jgi:hypothetical protein